MVSAGCDWLRVWAVGSDWAVQLCGVESRQSITGQLVAMCNSKAGRHRINHLVLVILAVWVVLDQICGDYGQKYAGSKSGLVGWWVGFGLCVFEPACVQWREWRHFLAFGQGKYHKGSPVPPHLACCTTMLACQPVSYHASQPVPPLFRSMLLRCAVLMCGGLFVGSVGVLSWFERVCLMLCGWLSAERLSHVVWLVFRSAW
jgi:hypothetical protein